MKCEHEGCTTPMVLDYYVHDYSGVTPHGCKIVSNNGAITGTAQCMPETRLYRVCPDHAMTDIGISFVLLPEPQLWDGDAA